MFLAEGYLSSATAEELAHSGKRAAHVAGQIASSGPVRYLGSVFLPSDQACLLLFEAVRAEDVTDACTLAGLPCERVTEALMTPAVFGMPMAIPPRVGPDEDGDETRELV